MTVILKGSTQLERLLPAISKAILGCERHGEVGLRSILERWRLEAVQFLYPVQQPNVATSADIALQTSHEPSPPAERIQTEEDNDEVVDWDLYEMTTAIREKYPDMPNDEIMRQAAHNLQYKIPLDKI
jgi:hypothetical protein